MTGGYTRREDTDEVKFNLLTGPIGVGRLLS